MITPGSPTATVALRDVEPELDRQMRELQGSGEGPLLRARMSNLVIFCNTPEQAVGITAAVPGVVTVHPARVLLLIGEPGPESCPITATVTVHAHRIGKQQTAYSGQVTLHAVGATVSQLPYAVRRLLVGDLPTNLWWAAPQPPPLAGELLFELAEHAQQIIYDSIGWREPARGVIATADWLEQLEARAGTSRWQVASDLNWRRLKYWRRLVAQALEPASAPGAVESISEVVVEHGPHAVIQAWELIAWMARRLGWQVLTGKVKPGIEIAWRFLAPHGDLRVRLRRLEQGPPEVRRVHLSCTLEGKPAALNLVVEDERRLAIIPEGIEGAARTVSVPAQTAADLVGRQLSDREPDPVFRESMSVAQSLARSVLS